MILKADLNLRTGKYRDVDINRIISSRATLYTVQLNGQLMVIKVYSVENKGEQQRAMYLSSHLQPRLRKIGQKNKFLDTTILKDFPKDFGSITLDEEIFPCALYMYIEGFDLYDRNEMKHSLISLDKKKIKFTEFIKIAYHLSTTISILHRYGVIHGDLVPTNIRLNIVGSTLDLTIMDLDGAGYTTESVEGEKEMIPLVKGTDGIPGFAAPKEFFQNRVHKETDNWFLAMLLFHIITRGFTPYYFLKFADMSNSKLRRGFLSMDTERWPPKKEEIIKYLPFSTINNDMLKEKLLDAHERLLAKVFGSSGLFFDTFARGYANMRNRTPSNKFTLELQRRMRELNL